MIDGDKLFDKTIQDESSGGKFRDNRSNKADKPSVGSMQFVESTALNFLKSNPKYAKKFKGKAFTSDDFFTTWNALEDKDPEFLPKTKKYAKRTHLDPVIAKHKLAEEDMDSFASMSINLGARLLNKAITRAGSTDISAVAQEVINNKEKYFSRLHKAGEDLSFIEKRYGKYIKPKVLKKEEIYQGVLARPVDEDVQHTLLDDMFSLGVSRISRAPNGIVESKKLIDSVSSETGISKDEPQKLVDVIKSKINQVPVQDTSLNFGGSSSFQKRGILERGTRSVVDTVIETPSYLYDKVTRIPNIEQEDIEGLYDNFKEQLTEESGIGNLIQRGLQGALTSGEIDTNYNPKEDMLYEDLTKDLDTEDLDKLLTDYSYNEKDFRTVAIMMNKRNERIKNIKAYSKENPVLSGVNFLGSMLTDAAIFAPVTSVIAAQGAATLTGASFKSLSAAKKLGWIAAAEIVEQGGQELVWNAYKKDYEFSLPIFMASVGLGVGVRGVIDSVQNNKMLRELISNEDGFIRLGKEQGEKLVKEVAKEADNVQATQLARRLVDLKNEKILTIRKKLIQDFDIVQVGIETSKKLLKSLKKGTPEFKMETSNLQKLIRRSKTLEKSTSQELGQLIKGTHPKLATALSPEFSLKTLSKELGIDYKLVNTPEKVRKFLGITSGDFAESLVVDGEKGYELILKKQLKELETNKRINANHFLTKVSDTMATSPLDIQHGFGGYLNDFVKGQASTDSYLTKYVFNKGNLVNSENAHVRGFYNWLAPDNSGRQGMSKIRAGETKTIYRNIYHGTLMDNYKTQGYDLLKHLNSNKGLKNKLGVYADFTKFENEVVPIFGDRLRLPSAEFKAKYPDPKVQEISDEFAKGWNNLNKQVADDAISKGVIGVNPSSEDYIYRAWASNKARLIPKDDLAEAIYEGMYKSLTEAGLPIEEEFLRKQAKDFTFGLQSKDITHNIEATASYIENLNKFLKSAEGQSTKEVTDAVESAIKKADAQKLANELGELGRRADIDMNVEIPNTGGKTLNDILEDNFISTQDRYNSRMAARTAAAEHGIKDIKVLDSWRADAILEEKKRLIANNSEHIAENVDYLDKVLKQDIKSFQYGGLGGQGDVLEAEANDVIRLLKKVSVTNLMQNVGIASIAEFGGTIAEVGVFNAVKSTIDPIQHMLRKNHLLRSGISNVRSLTDDMAALTGIGLGDMAFSSRGVSQAERIYKNGILGAVENGIDAAGSVTQNTLGWIETVGRKATSNSLAIKWGQHFKGNKPKGLISKFFSLNKGTTNRTLENSGLGQWIEENGKQVFKTNSLYDNMKENYLKHVSYDSNGSVKAMNFDKWQPEARDTFRNTIKMQTSHIYADPDSTTAAFWQTTSLGRILNQFRTFSVNATSKIAGFTYGNLANGIKHNDMDEVLRFSNKMFWAATMGTMAVALRDEMTTLGSDESKGFSDIADAPLQSIAIGFSRSSLIGNMDTINGIGGSLFGYDNIFNKSSFTGRDKNFFNLASTPIGQIGVNSFQGVSSLLQGDLEGAGKAAGNLTPFKRQLGIQQAINYLNK